MNPSTKETSVTDEPDPMVSAPSDPPLKQETKGKRTIFTGRLDRLGYLLANLYWGLILLALCVFGVVVTVASHAKAAESTIGYIVGLTILIFLVITAVFSVGFLIRRFHDLGQSGWFALLTLIPGAGGVLFIILLILPGNEGPNRYGQVPKSSFGFRDVSGL